MQTLLGFLFGFILIATGTSLECEVCVGTGTNCTGKMETCEAGKDTCIITVSESIVVGLQIPSVIKGCESSEICKHGPQYMNFGNGQEIRTHAFCCVGEACRTVDPQVPQRIRKPNGKQCPACYALFSNTCDEHEMVDCVGPENDCLDLEAVATHGPIVVRTIQKGCVTKGICADIKLGEINTGGIRSVVSRASCKPATFKPE